MQYQKEVKEVVTEILNEEHKLRALEGTIKGVTLPE